MVRACTNPLICSCPPYTEYNCVYHTLFSMLDISAAVGIVSVPKEMGVGNISPRAFRRRIVRYRHWHTLGCRDTLGCRAIELGKKVCGKSGVKKKHEPLRYSKLRWCGPCFYSSFCLCSLSSGRLKCPHLNLSVEMPQPQFVR